MLRKYLFQDWEANQHDPRIRWMLVAFRLAQRISRMNRYSRRLLSPYLNFYKFVLFWIFHVELYWTLEIGSGLRIFHGYCLVIHPKTKIGHNVTLRHGVTLGNKTGPGAPTIEDGAEIGAHALVLGPITVGANAVVGAGAVVTKDVPPNAVVAGNPAKILYYLHDKEKPSANDAKLTNG